MRVSREALDASVGLEPERVIHRGAAGDRFERAAVRMSPRLRPHVSIRRPGAVTTGADIAPTPLIVG